MELLKRLINRGVVRAAPKAAPVDLGLIQQRMLFVSHHKCASGVVAQCLVQLCSLNGLSYFPSHWAEDAPSSLHDVTFLSNADYKRLGAFKGRGVHIIRNPLDVIHSAYWSHLRTHPVDGWPELAAQREILTGLPAAEGMMLTLAFCEREDFYRNTPGPIAALRQWNFDDPRFVTVRMEDFGEDMVAVLATAAGDLAKLHWPAPDQFTFQRISGGRAPGEVDASSHYRNGRANSWRQELPFPIIRYVRRHMEGTLRRFYPESLTD